MVESCAKAAQTLPNQDELWLKRVRERSKSGAHREWMNCDLFVNRLKRETFVVLTRSLVLIL